MTFILIILNCIHSNISQAVFLFHFVSFNTFSLLMFQIDSIESKQRGFFHFKFCTWPQCNTVANNNLMQDTQTRGKVPALSHWSWTISCFQTLDSERKRADVSRWNSVTHVDVKRVYVIRSDEGVGLVQTDVIYAAELIRHILSLTWCCCYRVCAENLPLRCACVKGEFWVNSVANSADCTGEVMSVSCVCVSWTDTAETWSHSSRHLSYQHHIADSPHSVPLISGQSNPLVDSASHFSVISAVDSGSRGGAHT